MVLRDAAVGLVATTGDPGLAPSGFLVADRSGWSSTLGALAGAVAAIHATNGDELEQGTLLHLTGGRTTGAK